MISSKLLQSVNETCLGEFMFSCAYADSTTQGQSPILGLLVPLAIVILMYFILIRPQQKRQKAHQALISALKPGDKVMTGGGLIAKVVKILNDNEILIEVSNNVQCRFMKAAIISVITDKPAVNNPQISSK